MGSLSFLQKAIEGKDVLEASGYEVEGLREANHNFGKLYIALEIALRI